MSDRKEASRGDVGLTQSLSVTCEFEGGGGSMIRLAE